MKLKFLVNTEPYTKGDVVDFPEDRAQDLIRQGVAEEVSQETPLKIAAEEKTEEESIKSVETKAITPEDVENK